jgi:hypothetical protein
MSKKQKYTKQPSLNPKVVGIGYMDPLDPFRAIIHQNNKNIRKKKKVLTPLAMTQPATTGTRET